MVQNKTNYSKLADYYDLIYSITPPNDGIFYKKYINKNTEVLEMGIGTGRVFLDFFDLGVKWTGIDYSEEMIEKCKEKIEPLQPLKEKINLVVEDMTQIDIRKEKQSIHNKLFDLVIYPSHSIMSVGNENNQKKAICSGLKHLSKDGFIIFDLHNPNNYFVDKNYKILGTKTIKKIKYKLFSKSSIDYHSKLHSNYMILEYENNKIKFESHEYFLYLEDVINLSDELNFEIVDIYGNYEMDPFIEDSDELIIIGKKKDVG